MLMILTPMNLFIKVACLLNEFNFDSAFNYQNYQGDYNLAFKKYCPNGIDIDFENVGGPILEAAIENINQQATIILCGAISQYNTINPRKGPSNFAKMTDKKAKLIGYIVTDYDHIFPEFECYIYQKFKMVLSIIVKQLLKDWRMLGMDL